MKRAFLIRRKGFNYYTDYTEVYLHNTLNEYGYSLVKDKNKSLFSVTVFISDIEKDMIAVSPCFDKLSDEEATIFAKKLSLAFKSEVVVVPDAQDINVKGSPYECMFSDSFSSFDEPPFVKDVEPELVRRTYSICKNGQPHIADYTNYGGAFKGLKINIAFENDVALENTTINYYVNKKLITEDIVFEKNENGFCCVLKDFEMTEGINKYSTAMRGKKKADEETYHGFYLRFIPVIKDAKEAISEITIETL